MPENNRLKHSSLSTFHWVWSAVCSIVVLVTVALRYALPVRDGDLWWHMLYGKYFLEHKTLIADHTIFSWTPATNDTIYCTWLPDIFLYLLHTVAGLSGLFAFRYACLFLFVLICFLLARRLRTASNPVVWLIILIGVLMSYVAAYLKPEIVSYVLMTLLVWIWWRIRTGGTRVYLWCYAMPVLMTVWVNSHGAFIFGYIFLAAVVVGEILNTWWSHGNALSNDLRKHLWIAIGLSLIAPMVTPYGWRYPAQLFWTLVPTEGNLAYNSKIFAYTPTFKLITPFHDFTLYANLAILVLAVLYFINLKKKRIEWSSLLSNLAFALLYTLYLRTTFFWAPVFAGTCIKLVGDMNEEFTLMSNKKRIGFGLITLIILISLSSDAIETGFTQPERNVIAGRFGISFFNPVDSANYIHQNFAYAKKIGNTYNAGSYLLWTLWPDSEVLIDSRHFPYKKWSQEFFDFSGGKNFPSFLNKYPADIWCIDHGDVELYSRFLYSPNWKLAYYGRGSSVFVSKQTSLPRGDTFQVEKNIEDTNNIFVFLCTYLFAVKSHDWPTAESLLAKMEASFPRSQNESHVMASKTILHGMKAFSEKKYDLAINIFSKLPVSFKMEIAISHLHLAQSCIDSHQYEQARKHVYDAIETDPDPVYNLFNAALIDWILYERHPGYRNDSVEKSCKNKFNAFVRYADQDPDDKQLVEIAKRIASRDFKDIGTLPPLVIPQFHRS